MKAYVDQDLCIGCGLCADELPEVFSMNADDVAEAVLEELDEATAEKAKATAENCPVEAISVR